MSGQDSAQNLVYPTQELLTKAHGATQHLPQAVQRGDNRSALA